MPKVTEQVKWESWGQDPRTHCTLEGGRDERGRIVSEEWYPCQGRTESSHVPVELGTHPTLLLNPGRALASSLLSIENGKFYLCLSVLRSCSSHGEL